MLVRVVWKHVSGEMGRSDWMAEDRAEDLADDLDGQGVYEWIRLEMEP